MVNPTVIIVQARMSSTRLPGKVMLPIRGIPMIGILIERLKKACLPIILATSTNFENDELAEYAKTQDIAVFRGSETNVLERYYLAAEEANAQTIVRITADNPLIDGGFIRGNVEEYWKKNDERTYLTTGLTQTYPLGMSAEVFSFNLLEEAFHNAKLPEEIEHVTPYMHQNKPENIQIISLKRKESKYNYRLTVDTPEDFVFIKKLIEDFGCDQLGMDEIIKVIYDHPTLQSMNRNSYQKKWNE
jgi:spore coat polysaccharide biosynthesis protein SpsF